MNPNSNKRQIRTLHIIDQLGIGGKERRLGYLMEGINSELFPSGLISFGKGNFSDWMSKSAKFVSIRNRKWRWDIAPIFWIRKAAKIFDADIIQSWDFMSAFYGLIVAKIINIPFVNSSISDAQFHKDWRMKMKKRILKYSDYVVANSSAGLKAYDLNESHNTSIIYNGIQCDSDPLFTTNNEKIRIGVIANLTDKKDYPTIFKAIAKLHEQKYEFKLTVIGDGDRRREYLDFAFSLGISEKLIFLGQQIDVAKLISEFDICLLASYKSMGEGLSNSLLEYMREGKPIVATDVGGTSELIVDGLGGFLSPAGDPKIFAENIALLLNDANLRRDMGWFNYERVKKLFSLNSMIDKYAKLYTEISNNK